MGIWVYFLNSFYEDDGYDTKKYFPRFYSSKINIGDGKTPPTLGKGQIIYWTFISDSSTNRVKNNGADFNVYSCCDDDQNDDCDGADHDGVIQCSRRWGQWGWRWL